MEEDIVDEEDAGEEATIGSSLGRGEAVSGHNGRLQVGFYTSHPKRGTIAKPRWTCG
jgi:hypothetical protein